MKNGLVIVGFPKCGQVSLIQHLQDKFKDTIKDTIIKKDEVIWNRDGVSIFKEKYGHNPNIRPVIITRDPIKRIWSSYWYFDLEEKPFREKYTYEEYLKIDLYAHHFGELNPIRCSNYDRWIKIWKPLNPLLYNLEELIQLDNFPHLNKTEYVRKVPDMSRKHHDLTKKMLDEEIDRFL